MYGQYGAPCHGEGGRGDGPNASYLAVPPAAHADGVFMARRSDDMLFDAIAGGGVLAGRSNLMPAFGATLSQAEIRALIRYLRSLCTCQGPPWSTAGKVGVRTPQ